MGSECQVILQISVGAKKEKLHPFDSVTECSSLTTAGTYGPRPELKKRWTVQRAASLEAARIVLLVTPRYIKHKIKQKTPNSYLINIRTGRKVCAS